MYLFLLAPLLLSVGSPAGLPEVTASYQAQFVITIDTQTLSGTLYHSQNRKRLDYTIGENNFSLLLLKTEKLAWLLLPEAPIRFKIPLGASHLPSNLLETAVLQKGPSVGSRVIEGVRSKGFSITLTHSDDAIYKGLIWLSPQNIPTKIHLKRSPKGPRSSSAPNHFNFTLSELVLQPLPPQVFEVPQNLNTLDIGELITLSPPVLAPGNPKTHFESPSP